MLCQRAFAGSDFDNQIHRFFCRIGGGSDPLENRRTGEKVLAEASAQLKRSVQGLREVFEKIAPVFNAD